MGRSTHSSIEVYSTADQEEKFVLDTHIWLWLVNGDKRIALKTVKAIEKSAGKGSLFISAISIWEVAMLARKQRIILSKPLTQWIDYEVSRPGLDVVALTPDIAVHSTQLPGSFCGDPADCMIIATARLAGATLITHDKAILAYAKQGYVKACL